LATGLREAAKSSYDRAVPASEAELAASYAAALDDGAERFADSRALGARIRAALDAARERFPEIALDDRAAARYLGERAAAGDDDPGVPAHAADLLLAQACAGGDPFALAILERDLLARTVPVLRRLGFSASECDDVLQEVRERILVGVEGAPPKILSYGGSGALIGWLRAVVGRQGLMRRRRVRRDVTLDEAELLDSGGDPLLEALKQRYRAAFAAAFRAAVDGLDARDRAILKAVVLEQVPIAKVAQLYKVHRVTASRWLARIREDLLATTRDRLATALDLDPAEIDSAIRLIRSNLDVSLVSALS
jgi:RNA polymerase sigma-70 factor (ECF subfamily)